MSRIVWVHEDCLDPRSPAFRAAPDAPALFVFDDAVLRHRGYGLKRIGFIYECLLELPVRILRGDTASIVRAFAAAHGATIVVTMASPCPQLRRLTAELDRDLKVEAHEPAPLVADAITPDLRRFSRYWRAAAGSAMRPSVSPASAGAAGRAPASAP